MVHSVCELDGKTFGHQISLYQHQEKHDNITHICEICDKIFNTKRYFKEHKKKIHEGKTFECEECDSKFTI